jgi:hypothetical protein
VAAGGVIKTTDKAESGGGKDPLTTGDGVLHSGRPTAAAPLLQAYGGGTDDPWLRLVELQLVHGQVSDATGPVHNGQVDPRCGERWARDQAVLDWLWMVELGSERVVDNPSGGGKYPSSNGDGDGGKGGGTVLVVATKATTARDVIGAV